MRFALFPKPRREVVAYSFGIENSSVSVARNGVLKPVGSYCESILRAEKVIAFEHRQGMSAQWTCSFNTLQLFEFFSSDSFKVHANEESVSRKIASVPMNSQRVDADKRPSGVFETLEFQTADPLKQKEIGNGNGRFGRIARDKKQRLVLGDPPQSIFRARKKELQWNAKAAF